MSLMTIGDKISTIDENDKINNQIEKTVNYKNLDTNFI
jgi:hypothetical protein